MRNQITIEGQKLWLKSRAPEPSNVIWENHGIPDLQVQIRQLVVFILIGLILVVMYGGFTIVGTHAFESESLYPRLQDCKSLEQRYGDYQVFRKYALKDKEYTLKGHGLGIYQCFCQKINSIICEDYTESVNHAQIYETLTSFLVVGFNFILQIIVMVLVPKIGHKVRDQVVETMASFMFYSEFLNTGFLLLLV